MIRGIWFVIRPFVWGSPNDYCLTEERELRFRGWRERWRAGVSGRT
jgi:hypothetical protein